jgi:hypothetical protein
MDARENRGPIVGRARLRRPYLSIVVFLALAAAVIGAGYLGPHTSPRATPTPLVSVIARATGSASPPSAPTPAATGPLVSGIDGLTGLKQVNPEPAQILSSAIQEAPTGFAPAAIGLRLFYVLGGDRIEATEIGSGAAPQTLVQVPVCEGINQLAAAGHELAYVVTAPAGRPVGQAHCGSPSAVAWSVWLLNLDGGAPRQVAAGVREAGTATSSRFPIYVALTDAAYAFDRPSAAAGDLGETIEVHALDDRLLWASPTDAPVKSVMLGGGRLAFLTDGAPLVEGLLDLWTSTVDHPVPAMVARPASSASLSPDGAYLTWDLAPTFGRPTSTRQSAVAVDALASGQVGYLETLTDSTTPLPLRPAISAAGRGALVAWYASAPDGAVYPAFRFLGSGGGAVLATSQRPVWIAVDGGRLIWVAENADESATLALAVDVSGLGPG